MKVLWLSHFVPYPPTGGMRQRSYNLLRSVAARHEVDLVALNQRALLPTPAEVDEARAQLGRMCASVTIRPIPADRSRWRWRAMAAAGWLRSDPYHVNWLRSGDLHATLSGLSRSRSWDLVHADTLGMAPYALQTSRTALVVNHHNVESHMLARRAAGERNPLARVYMRREAHKLERYERGLCGRGVMNLMCSADDLERLDAISRGASIRVVENGVDVEYFRPVAPLGRNGGQLVFTGQLNWYANRDAVRFLLAEIWPRLAEGASDRRLVLAGRDPSPEALAAASTDRRITVTGAVEDMRPHLDESSIYICPLRTGGGTRLKILDALAMAKPIVATGLAVEGLEVVEGEHFLRAETPAEFVNQVQRLEADEALRARLARAGRSLVERRYSWEVIGKRLDAAYRDALAGRLGASA